MIRKYYINFHNKIINNEKANNYFITNNPEIEKTLISYYLICYLAKFNKSIIYTIRNKFIKFLSNDI